MITAKNYAAQVANSIRNAYFESKSDSNFSKFYANKIEQAVHFAIPDKAKLLDDGLKGINGEEIRLPFPCMTVEYYSGGLDLSTSGPFQQEDKASLQKVCILAIEHPSEMYEEKGFSVHSFGFSDGRWGTMPIGLFVPRSLLTGDIQLEDIKIVGTLPDSYSALTEPLTLESKKAMYLDTIKISMFPVLELIEALTCRNVSTTNHQDASPANAKRVKAGKLPIYETKMLVIDVNYTASGKKMEGGSHASPRQHLRRGHIRRLESGNIWVNSCVVGDPEKGIINKQYRVKK